MARLPGILIRPFALALFVASAGACATAAAPNPAGGPGTSAATIAASTTAPATTVAPASPTTAPAFVVTTTTLPEIPPLVVDGPGRYDAEVISGGLVRRFLLVVPESAPDPSPLVLVFHGFTRSPEEIEETSGMSALAEEHGFIVAYPAGTGFPRRWLSSPLLGDQDVTFARDLVAAVSAAVGIDPQRVYAAGMSNGGGMAARLACDAADLFAAVGPVAAAYPAGGACDPERPVAWVAIHGTADPIVPYEGLGEALPAVEGVVAFWVGENGCRAGPVIEAVAGGVTRLTWGDCADGADVVLYRVVEGRHGWPGSGDASPWGATTDAIGASALLWEFFAAHPMP